MLHATLKSLGRDSVLYGIAGGLQRLSPLIIVPILAHNMSPEAYGVYDTAVAAAMMLVGFAIMGQDNAVARFLQDDRSMAAHRVIATSGFIIQIVAVFMFVAIFAIWGDQIGRLIFGESSALIDIWTLALWIVPGFALLLFSQNLLKWMFLSKWYVALCFVFSVVSIGLTVMLVVILGMGIKGAVVAQISAYGVLALLGIYSVKKFIRFNNMMGLKRVVPGMFAYGFPFILVMVFSNALPIVDRFFIVRLDTMTNLGVYAIGLKVSMLMLIVLGPLQIAFGPIALSMWDKKDAPSTFRSLARMVVVGLGFLALLLAANGHILLRLIGGGSYESAVFLLPFLCVAMVMSGMLEFTLLGITKSKKSKYNLLVVVVGLVTTLVSNALLIPLIGIVGAAISAVVVQGFMNVCAHLISIRYYERSINVIDMIKGFALLAAGMCVVYMGHLNHQSGVSGVLMFLTPFGFVVVGWIWILNIGERQQIIKLLSGFVERVKSSVG